METPSPSSHPPAHCLESPQQDHGQWLEPLWSQQLWGWTPPAGSGFHGASLSPHQDCYILDQGGLKIYVWKGKNANAQERTGAMNQALVGMGVREGKEQKQTRQGVASGVRLGVAPGRGLGKPWA